MDYQQIHDFSAQGASRFAEFLFDHASRSVNIDACRLSCLGTLEEALNGLSAAALEWPLPCTSSSDGAVHVFTVDWQDIIVETISLTPGERG